MPCPPAAVGSDPATPPDASLRPNSGVEIHGQAVEQILDTAKRLGETSPYGRLCPPFLACLDELPSTAPIPTLS